MSRRPTYPATTSYGSINPNPEELVQSPVGMRSDPNAYPQVFDPEHGPQTVHRSDLFFVNNSQMNPRQNSDFPHRFSNASAPPVSNQLYPYHQQAFHHYSPPAPPPPPDFYPQYQQPPPNYPQARGAYPPLGPPLPPKPIVYPSIKTTTNYEQYAARPPATLPPPGSYPPPPLQYEAPQPPYFEPPPPLPPPPPPEEPPESPVDDPNELAMALALSQSESIEHQKLQEQLMNQEEEDLARALAESMLSTGSTSDPSSDPFFAPMPSESMTLPNSKTGSIRKSPSPPPPISINLPAQNASDPDRSPNIPPSDNSFPEFGRHNKCRPLVENVPNGGQSSTINVQHSDEEPFDSYLTASEPTTGALSKRLSIASISSLAYMQPESDPEPVEGKHVNSTTKDNEEDVQDGRDVPRSPSISNLELNNLEDLTPSKPFVCKEDLTVVIPDELVEPHVLVFDDEAYARQLAAEEEALAAQEYQNEKARPMPIYDKDLGQALPLYAPDDQQHNVGEGPSPNHHSYVERQPMYPSHSYNGTSSTPSSSTYSSASSASQQTEHTPPFYGRRASDPNNFRAPFPSSSGMHTMPTIPYSPVISYPTLRTRRDTESDTHSEASHNSPNHTTATAPAAVQSANQNSSPPPAFNEPQTPASAISMTSAGVLNANHFLDSTLLMGVSIGFKPPPISPSLQPMEDPMPNIISLPYARCPPLHLQAPNWSHLLRLMARLSGTRIEPTVEAMAVNKTELKLRTVVQFIKPNPQTNDWRTILWFTIDHPVPPTVPGASRYTAANPNLLPWSYTLSPIPLLLRDATDTHISKTYTIPASDSVPLPTLPITFPNLALYLQAALDASRRHSGDSSSGLGKLGKTVQLCYPNVGQTGLSEFDIPERPSVTHLFKRVIGRSSKDKKKGKTSNNEETYQLVTPFVPDEWG